MKHIKDIIIEGIFDTDDHTRLIDDFINKPFQSIFNCGPNIKNQKDWESYLYLFEKSISVECESSFEHDGNYTYTAAGHRRQWVLSIMKEGSENRKVIKLNEYKGPYEVSQIVIASMRNFPNKVRIISGWSIMNFHFKDQKCTCYVLSKKQMKVLNDMLDNWARGDFQDWLKK